MTTERDETKVNSEFVRAYAAQVSRNMTSNRDELNAQSSATIIACMVQSACQYLTALIGAGMTTAEALLYTIKAMAGVEKAVRAVRPENETPEQYEAARAAAMRDEGELDSRQLGETTRDLKPEDLN